MQRVEWTKILHFEREMMKLLYPSEYDSEEWKVHKTGTVVKIMNEGILVEGDDGELYIMQANELEPIF